MTKQDLQKKLRANYNRDTWKEVLLEMFPEADLFAQDLSTPLDRKEQQNLANHIVQYGEVVLGDDTLIFLEVELKPESVQLTRNRVGLRRLIDNEVVAGLTDAALITYYQPETDEWRISFYSERYGWDEDGKNIKEETHPKRYTYVVGPAESCKTVAGQLIDVVDKGRENTLEHVLKAFSVQKVSKEFFKEYKEQYDKFVGHLTGKNWTKNGVKDVGERISQFQFYFKATTDHEKEARDFVKKLLGRIVFLYFVQKKLWLGASSTDFKDGNPDFIYDLFKQVPEEDGKKEQFYSQWLTKLFFDTLNKDDDHAFEMPDGSTMYIPFLNGGLFEKDETDKNTESLPLPGKLFSNPEDTESPNTRGFLDFLSAFNFTIHEDSPGDHTIAVDPEMLGHIFENLLEDNKDKGAYYTPKPIVHYMCQESLIEYLLTELTAHSASSGQAPDTEDNEKNELRNHLEDLIKKQEAGELVGQTEDILKALKKVKVCDPAIGSGAFPMGILQEIYQAVETLHHLSPDNVQAIWELPDEKWHPAEVKKQIIQNSIYGVDIEKGAVDIARLRFWLSLIVDEKEPTALPNLDYKIVVGDSLVSRLVLNGQEKVVEINWEVKESVGKAKEHVENLRQTLDEIVIKQKDFFEADNEAKKELREEIKKLKIDALIYQLKYDREYFSQNTNVKGGMMPTSSDKEHNLTREVQLKEFTKLIEDLQKVKGNPNQDFQHFDWKLDFPEILNEQINEETGFNIVIANPPYVEHKKLKGTASLLKTRFQVYTGSSDLSVYFFELAFKMLKEKGHICYINTNKFFSTGYGKSLRKYLLEYKILSMINFEQVEVFDDILVSSVVFIAENNSEYSSEHSFKYLEFKEENDWRSKFLNRIENDTQDFIQTNFSEKEWTFFEQNEMRIKSKVELYGKVLKKIDGIEIKRGVTTGFDDAFVIDSKTKKNLGSPDIIKPLLMGRDIKKYNYNFSERYLINSHNGLKNELSKIDLKSDYPAIYDYMNKVDQENENKVRNRYDQGDHWTNLRNCAFLPLFEKEKIIWPLTADKWGYALDKGNHYLTSGGYLLVSKNLAHNYVLAFLNSRLLEYYFKFIGVMTAGGAFTLKKSTIERLPIYDPIKVDLLVKERIEDLVNKILAQKEAIPEADTTDLENQIDVLVYKLYNLTWEEVQVVDPDFWLSEKEYDRFEVEG